MGDTNYGNLKGENSTARGVGGTAARQRGVKFIRSFNIRKNSDRTKWYLYVNQKTLIGIFPTQSYAIDALFGAVTSVDGRDAMAITSLQAQLDAGISRLDPDINILAITDAGSTATGTDVRITVDATLLTSVIDDPFSPSSFRIDLEKSDDGGSTWSEAATGGFISGQTTYTQTFNATVFESSVPEDTLFRAKLMQYDSLAALEDTQSRSETLLRDDLLNSLAFSVVILDGEGSGTIDLGDTAVATPDGSASVGVDPDTEISYAYQWYQSVPTLGGITLTNEGS